MRLQAALNAEAPRCRRALEEMPEGGTDWKPHDRSMPFGYLSQLVATMPSWIAMEITRGDLDLNPPGGAQRPPAPMESRAALLAALDKGVSDARAALQQTADAHLDTPWRLLVAGKVVWEGPRQEIVRDTFGHLAHHRGQMTVYLRLLGAKVPALYGPSADERIFG